MEHPSFSGAKIEGIDHKNPPKPIPAEDLEPSKSVHDCFAGKRPEAIDHKNPPKAKVPSVEGSGVAAMVIFTFFASLCLCCSIGRAQFSNNVPGVVTNTPGFNTNPPAATPFPVTVWSGTNNPNGLYTGAAGSIYNQFDATGTSFIQTWIKQSLFGTTNWVERGPVVRNTASFEPHTAIHAFVNLVQTNDDFPFGTSTTAATGALHYNTNIVWIDDLSVSHTGAWTNATQTVAYDVGLAALVIDATPLNAGNFTYSFSIEPNFDYNLHQFVVPQGVAWSANVGSGTFMITNNLVATLFTNNYTLGFTNNYDFAAHVHALPLATNQTGFRGGGLVEVPPGLNFTGTNAFVYHQGFALDIEGQLGGMTVLVITNGDGRLPGLLLGTDVQSPQDDNPFPEITMRNIVVCNQNDFTNYVLEIEQTAKTLLENVTVAPFSSYLGNSQWGVGGTADSKAIGIGIFMANGQQCTLNNITVDAEHDGIEIRADHPTITGLNLYRNGAAGSSGWATNSIYSCPGVGLILDGSIANQITGTQFFDNYLDILNNQPTGENSPNLIIGGDWGEGTSNGKNARTGTMNPNANAMFFIQNNPFSPGTISDKMMMFTGTSYDVSVTNNPGIWSMYVFGNGSSSSFNIVQGGTSVLLVSNGIVSGNGFGIGGIPGFTGSFGIQTNSVGPHGITLKYSGGIVTNQTIY